MTARTAAKAGRVGRDYTDQAGMIQIQGILATVATSVLPVNAPARPRWALRAMLGGFVSAAIGAAILAVSYHSSFPDLGPRWSWTSWAASISVVGPLSGALWGLCVCGGIVAAGHLAARGWTKLVANPVVGGALGGMVGATVPSVLGVVGYGSLHAPYAGTASIATSVLVAVILFAVLGSMPGAIGRTDGAAFSRSFAASLIAAVLVVVPFGSAIAGMVCALMPEDVIRDVVAWIGVSRVDSRPWVLATIGLGVAAVFGPLVGTFVGCSAVVARIVRGVLPARG